MELGWTLGGEKKTRVQRSSRSFESDGGEQDLIACSRKEKKRGMQRDGDGEGGGSINAGQSKHVCIYGA